MQTGEILSQVSIPNFNPHKIDMKNGDSFMNKRSSGLFEFGSDLKPVIMASD